MIKAKRFPIYSESFLRQKSEPVQSAEEAQQLIALTKTPKGRDRDLVVLRAALQVHSTTLRAKRAPEVE